MLTKRVMACRMLLGAVRLLCSLAFFVIPGGLCGAPLEKSASPKSKEGPVKDTITLEDGKTLVGILHDVTEKNVILDVDGEKKTFPRKKVKEIQRGAEKTLFTFFDKKLGDYSAAKDAKSLKKLADWCTKRGLMPERRRALRELVLFDPNDADARTELGHILHEGNWLDEDAIDAKLKEGFELVDGQLVKPTSTVVKKEAEPPAYKMLERKKLTSSERDRIERERKDRLRDAEKFLAQKQREYEGVAWEKRHSIKTRHFEVQCNSTEKVAQAYSKLVEIIRAKLAEMFPSRIYRNARSAVFIYASQEDFMAQDRLGRWMGRGLGGYYRPDNQSISTYHGTFGFTGTTFGVLCHEGTHYYQGLVLKDFDNIPIWLVEGLAVYFGDGSIFDPKTAKIEVGKIPRDRLAHIQEKMLMKRQEAVEKLVALTRESGGFGGSQYADAWALIYFLVNSGDKGKTLLTAYWAIGLERLLTKKDFVGLAEKYFGSIEELEKQYVDYVLKIEMPPSGKVVGDYFVSDIFQFDFKAPSEEWQFFDDREDKKLLVGLLYPNTSAEIRVYYENNLENLKREKFFDKYMGFAKKHFKDFEHQEVKIGNLPGYRVKYLDENPGEIRISDLSDLLEIDIDDRGGVSLKKKAKAQQGPREVVKFLLIQEDGIVTIDCSTKKGEGEKFAEVFSKVNENFTLMLTRRW